MANQGYIALHRKLRDNFLWKQKRGFSMAEAWIDLLMEAQHSTEPRELVFGMSVFVCNYGQILRPVTDWAKRWSWSRAKVNRFLKMLKSRTMIDTQNEHFTTRITICNYGKYDPRYRNSEHQTLHKTNRQRAPDEHQSSSKRAQQNNDKNVNNEKNGKGPASSFSSPKSFNQMDCEAAEQSFNAASKEFLKDG